MVLTRGPGSVSSARAVVRYREWKDRHRAAAEAFLRSSNQAVREFLTAGSWGQAEAPFARAREQGLRLGEEIGVPAALDPPAALAGALVKAVGAGNELGVAVAPVPSDGSTPADGSAPTQGSGPSGRIDALVPAWEGLQWQL
jgi:hypothetical protein